MDIFRRRHLGLRVRCQRGADVQTRGTSSTMQLSIDAIHKYFNCMPALHSLP